MHEMNIESLNFYWLIKTMTVEWPTPNVLYAVIFCFIIGMISVFTSALAIIVYFRSLTIRKASQNLLFLNLLINACIYSLAAAIYNGSGVISGNSNFLAISWICNFEGFINMFCCGMEIYTLMCIALERYFAIKKQKPLSFNYIIGLLIFGYCWEAFTARYKIFFVIYY
jgi:hypothetical protein